MTFDSRWKNPQGSDPKQLHLWAQDLIKELRKGEYLPATPAAADIVYDNGTSGLTAADVQAAVDEVEGRVDTLEASPGTHTLIASGALSSQATLDIPLDGDTWDEVEISLIDIVPATDVVELFMRFDQGAGVLSGASDYQWASMRNATAATDTADSEIRISDSLGSTAGERLTVKVHLYRPGDADLIKAAHWTGGQRNNGAAANTIVGWGELIANDNAITDVQFLMSSGDIASGYYYAVGKKYS
jgi:hypothetical protein